MGQGLRRLLVLAAALLAIAPYASVEALEPEWSQPVSWRAVMPDGGLLLEDGHEVVLAGIMPFPLDEEREERDGYEHLTSGLTALLDGQEIELMRLDQKVDRYGRPAVLARLRDGRIVQRLLTESGHAVVAPADVPPAMALSLLDHEAAGNGRGAGGERRPVRIDARRAYPSIGSHAIVRGRVVDVQKVRDVTYLNFGKNWRRDFTVRVAQDALCRNGEHARDPRIEARFSGCDLPGLKALVERRVEVRGFLFEEYGPMIEFVTWPAIEVLP